MFTAHASEFIGNPVFALKMSLILGAGVNAAIFHAVRALQHQCDRGAKRSRAPSIAQQRGDIFDGLRFDRREALTSARRG